MLGLVVTINGNAMPVASRLATFGPATKPQFLKNLNRQRVLSKEINAKKCSSECPYECGNLWARIYSEAPSTVSTFNKKWIDCNRNPGSTGAHFGHVGTYQIWKFLRFGGSVATSLAGTVYMDWVPDGWSVDNLKNRIPTEELNGWMQSGREKYLTTFILTSFPSSLPRAFISLTRAYLLRKMISIFDSADMSKKHSLKARRTWTVPGHHHDGVELSASFVISNFPSDVRETKIGNAKPAFGSSCRENRKRPLSDCDRWWSFMGWSFAAGKHINILSAQVTPCSALVSMASPDNFPMGKHIMSIATPDIIYYYCSIPAGNCHHLPGDITLTQSLIWLICGFKSCGYRNSYPWPYLFTLHTRFTHLDRIRTCLCPNILTKETFLV